MIAVGMKDPLRPRHAHV